jgi:hypothetical protein
MANALYSFLASTKVEPSRPRYPQFLLPHQRGALDIRGVELIEDPAAGRTVVIHAAIANSEATLQGAQVQTPGTTVKIMYRFAIRFKPAAFKKDLFRIMDINSELPNAEFEGLMADVFEGPERGGVADANKSILRGVRVAFEAVQAVDKEKKEVRDSKGNPIANVYFKAMSEENTEEAVNERKKSLPLVEKYEKKD